MNLDEAIEIDEKILDKTKYLSQRAIVVDKKKNLIVGYAPETAIRNFAEDKIEMKWFAYHNGKMLTANTLEGLFRVLLDSKLVDSIPYADWPRAESNAKTRIAIGFEKPFKSIEKFSSSISK